MIISKTQIVNYMGTHDYRCCEKNKKGLLVKIERITPYIFSHSTLQRRTPNQIQKPSGHPPKTDSILLGLGTSQCQYKEGIDGGYFDFGALLLQFCSKKQL